MTYIIYGVVGAAFILFFGAGWVFGYKSKPNPPCDNCDHLVRKGGFWKYYCDKHGYSDGFDKPPEYCKAFKPRGDTE